MELKSVKLEFPEGTNIIFGQTHFIKTVEDLYEIMIRAMPKANFGIAFCEASGACLIRVEGNDEEMKTGGHPECPGRCRRPHFRSGASATLTRSMS